MTVPIIMAVNEIPLKTRSWSLIKPSLGVDVKECLRIADRKLKSHEFFLIKWFWDDDGYKKHYVFGMAAMPFLCKGVVF